MRGAEKGNKATPEVPEKKRWDTKMAPSSPARRSPSPLAGQSLASVSRGGARRRWAETFGLLPRSLVGVASLALTV